MKNPEFSALAAISTKRYVNIPTPVATLLQEFDPATIYASQRLNFLGVDGLDVYNISAPFEFEGRQIIAGRVEPHDSEISAVMFFERVEETVYRVVEGVRYADLQDPCVGLVGGKLVLAATRVHTTANTITDWNTEILVGDSISSLSLAASAPRRMKDVRVFEAGGVLHVFTRPAGGSYGRGKLGYTQVPSLASLDTAAIAAAEVMNCHFVAGEWGGVNEVHLLANNMLGIVGHIAYMSEGEVRHYYPMCFAFDPYTRRSTKIKILCRRSDFAPGRSKRADLADVLFSGGLVRHSDGTATLYTGVSDAEAHRIRIIDPFGEYESRNGQEAN